MENRNLYISWSLRILLSALFVFSAVTKMFPIFPFEKQLVDFGFADWCVVPYLARLIIGVEFGLGIALIQNHYLKRVVVPSTALLLVVFCIHLSYQIFSGQDGNCGCFGQFIEMTPTEALIKNVVTLGLLGWLYMITKEKSDNQRFSIVLLIGSLSILLMFVCFPFSPCGKCPPCEQFPCPPSDTVFVSVNGIDTLNPVNAGPAPVKSKFSNFNVFDGRRVSIDKGKKIVCFFIPGCDHCREAAKSIAELSKDPNFPKVYIYFGDEEVERIDEFFQFAGKRFPYHVIGMVDFDILKGSQEDTPGILYLWNGNIQKSYFGKDFNKDDLKNVCYQ